MIGVDGQGIPPAGAGADSLIPCSQFVGELPYDRRALLGRRDVAPFPRIVIEVVQADVG